MAQKTFIVGVGMTAFEKPGARDWDYPDMAREAGEAALLDAGITYEEVLQVVAGYVYGDSTCGQRAAYELGLTGVPVFNVNNNGATGATALFLANQLVKGGIAECVLALGFEKMETGSLQAGAQVRQHPLGRHLQQMTTLRGMAETPPAVQFFGNAAMEHMELHGSTAEQFAQVAVKNHKHSVHNPRAQFRDEYTLEQVLDSRAVHGPITKLQCCPTSDGAAAALVVNEEFVQKHGLEEKAVEVLAMSMRTDGPSTFEKNSISLIGADMCRETAQAVYESSGLGPEDVDVVELHDCFSANELITYESLGLCDEGQGGELSMSGAVTYGGRWVVNPSGGLISKGHPLGATGIAQCAEICWQLRNKAEKRQVENARIGLQHNLGLGGACVVGMYRLGA